MTDAGHRALRILIVDDERRLVEVMGRALVEEGHTVDVAHDGLTGCACALRGAYDVVILDVGLPGMDGLEICRHMRGAGVGTAILLCSARDSIEDRTAGLDAGADHYLGKPFALLELHARVRALGRLSARPILVADVAVPAVPLAAEALPLTGARPAMREA
jgi:DNA-binding response OmpR family regulator